MISDNTSEDSIGTDSSFDSIKNEIEEGKFGKKDNDSLVEDLKFKHDRYIQYKKSIYQKNDEFKKEKSNSKWRILYYTFFNNFNQKSTITLNELELRCKFLFKMDKLEKEENLKKRNKSEEKKYNQPYTNLHEFIKYFSEKKYESYLTKFFSKNKKSKNRSQSPHYKKTINNTLNQTRNNLNNNININSNKNSNILSNNKIQKNFTILDMYNINEPIEVINKITRDSLKTEKTKRRDENISHILNNKHVYQVELENFKNEIKKNEKMTEIYNDYLDFKSNENFFIDNEGVDLIAKYGKEFEEQEELGININNFCNKVIKNIEPSQKLDF
jgi:hypothetical protein